MNNELKIQAFVLGDWQTNCYVVWREGLTGCWIVDAGFGPGEMLGAIKEMGLEPQKLVLTHAHVDHMAGIREVLEVYPDLEVAIHEAEVDFLKEPMLNLSAGVGLDITAPPPGRVLKDGEVLELEGLKFEVRHTPGHSPGGVCFYQEEAGVALVGDTLFAGSIGRYDFPTSDGPALMRSINERLLVMDDAVQVLPGHGPATTIGRERQTNPFLTPE